MKYFNENYDKVLDELRVVKTQGISDEEAKKRLEEYGYNEFDKKEDSSLWKDIKDALSEPMMIILLIAAAISGLIGEYFDAVGITGAVALGIIIGLVTEGKSKKAAEALEKMTENIAVKVLRDGHIIQISKSEIVPGDIVSIETGDMIPADGRLIETFDLKVREDILTGESDDVSKNADTIIEMETLRPKDIVVVQDPVPAKQINMVFGGTLVAYGRGRFVVTATGNESEMGRIASNLHDGDLETPLQKKLGKLGTTISKISSAIAFLIFIIMFVQMILANTIHPDTSGLVAFLQSIEPVKRAFIICIALVVAAVPEGLPTMINITLAITMQRMAKVNALVTKKEACETIGSISVICSDKTGTLTQNRMTVEATHINDPSYFVENCLVNSTADLEINESEVKYLGSATECALLLHHKDKDYMEIRNKANVLRQIPFSSQNKKMTTVMGCENDECSVLTKGAPEIVLANCKYERINGRDIELTPKRVQAILGEILVLQKQTMRVIAFAYKLVDQATAKTGEVEEMEEDMTFTGFVGIKDPLRLDVIESVATAKSAGISIKMLTGDNINTAKAIGEELGILDDGSKAVEATFIDTLSDEELKEEIKTIAIVARSKPDTKMRIVQALQANGEVVAVTGDGINDAPALTKADVGIAMGIAGTEVTKNAADIILTDDSFSTIIRGVKWGRGIYENFQRFIQFQITVNIVAFLIAILSVIFGFEMPFTTIQLLWINIIMDGPPALSLGLEAVRGSVLSRKPVNREASIITGTMIKTMLVNAAYMIFILLIQMKFNILGASTEKIGTASEAGTVVFALFAFSALFNAFNCREFGLDSIIPNFTKNPLAIKIISATALVQIAVTQIFSNFFNSVPLGLLMWIKVIGLASLIVVVNELAKGLLRLASKNKKNINKPIDSKQ